MKAENPNLLSKVNEFSNTLLEYNEFVIKQANIIKKEIFNNNALDLKKFNEQEVIIKKEIIYLILEQFYKDKLDLQVILASPGKLDSLANNIETFIAVIRDGNNAIVSDISHEI